ncbi:hypothetical protein [Paraburkholderia aspalathi]|uniref:hypothetical protein n=1 Tax=Paraburkholderia aspalathi TaxID=1324617 RepID=UPI0038B6D70D
MNRILSSATSLAPSITGTRYALITERYDFTLCQIDNSTLEAGGFSVSSREHHQSRVALHKVFEWIVDAADIVLTDKPFVKELDEGTSVAAALATGRAVFTRPMIRDLPEKSSRTTVRGTLGLGPGPIIVGSVGGTTMFIENKHKVIETYLDAYRVLKRERPDLQFVLLGREQLDVQDDVKILTYLPDWMSLLQEANALLSAPGWITVTEVAALRVPTIFVLSSLSEYHEVEALQRLKFLGFPTLIAPDVGELADALRPLVEHRETTPTPAQMAIAPDGSGTHTAADLLIRTAASISSRWRGTLTPVARLTAEPSKGHEATRMLLSSDGSTTALLEALIQHKLNAHVFSQEALPAAQLPSTAVSALEFSPNDIAIERRSALVAPDGSVINRNIVVVQKAQRDWIGKRENDIPLGDWMRNRSVKQHRKILSSGASTWPEESEHRACAYKEYIVSCDDGSRLYIHERFNPDYVQSPVDFSATIACPAVQRSHPASPA